jgi:hypothetical protein
MHECEDPDKCPDCLWLRASGAEAKLAAALEEIKRQKDKIEEYQNARQEDLENLMYLLLWAHTHTHTVTKPHNP